MKKKIMIAVLYLGAVLLAGCSAAQTIDKTENTTQQPTQSSASQESESKSSTIPESDTTSTSTSSSSEDDQNLNSLSITATVFEDQKYGAAYISLSQEEFEAAGFTLGDSCQVVFENGLEIEDVPYFNGYYVKNGEPILVAYPGFANIQVTYNNTGIWEVGELKDGDQITITLSESGKYTAVQEALSQQYSFHREDYTTDEEFCNFRALTGGSLKENFLYRGASPVDNSRGRAAYTDGLLEQVGIQFVMDLADSEEDIQTYIQKDDFASEYSRQLYENDQIALLDMGSAYTSEEYMQKVANGVKKMLQAEGPVYIHCMEGKDRTGFVCFLFEALAGASYEELQADYLTTYANYFQVTAEKTPEKYDAISKLYFDAFVSFLHNTEDMEILRQADYTQDAANYLISGGMTEEEVEAFKSMICK